MNGLISGCVITYLFTPTYGAAELEDIDEYIPLDHPCLLPNMAVLDQKRRSFAGTYSMVEIVDSAHNYSLELNSASQLEDVGDEFSDNEKEDPPYDINTSLRQALPTFDRPAIIDNEV
jgi:hypothetical protein